MSTIAIPAMSLEYDRAKDIKEFDDSKIGVKGLVDAGTTIIPKFFVHSPENLADRNSESSKDIPTVDLAGIESDRRSEIVEQIRDASHAWGFFQVTNHGIPATVLDDTINAVKSFNEQPTSVKAAFYTRAPGAGGFHFNTNVDLFRSKAATWRDTIQVPFGLKPVDPDRIPKICRKEIMEWDARATVLAETLTGLLSEGLGVGPGTLKEMTCLGSRLLAGHYYPYCPQADLTFGISSHSDPGILTVLLQDRIGGLQVKHGDEWVRVKPLPGALVINIGDLLQIISNGKYKSVEHRVIANNIQEPRISIAIFFNPSKRGDSDYYGPLPELLSLENPPLYRNFLVQEYMERFFKKGLDGKSHLDAFRL